jgi:hypothetical protein
LSHSSVVLPYARSRLPARHAALVCCLSKHTPLAGLRPCPEAVARCARRSLASGAGQIFFHQSEAPAGGAALGDALSFRVRADARSGKPVAVALRRLEPGELEPELRQPGGASQGRW